MIQAVQLEDRALHLLGTAHVSRRSVEEVERELERLQPDTVAVELDAARLQNLTDRESWQRLDIFQVLRQGKAMLLLSSLVMTSLQRRIAEQLGIEPGAEMLRAVEWARENDRELLLIDRDIQVTLKRTWRQLGFWTRIKTLSQLIGSLFLRADFDEEDIEKLKEESELTDMLQSLAQALPQVKGTLIDERDRYMAERLRRDARGTTVAVVGAGHVPGILGELEHDHDLGELERLPPPALLPKILQWAIPVAIVAIVVYGFLRGGAAESMTSIWLWFLVNGAFSALGAAIAFGHPLTVAAAFVAAPITSLNPLVAAGWVAGLVQAWVKRPTVGDLERLPEAITTLRGFWGSPVCRILLVVALANLGSTLGTVVAGSWIAARTL